MHHEKEKSKGDVASPQGSDVRRLKQSGRVSSRDTWGEPVSGSAIGQGAGGVDVGVWTTTSR